LFVQQEESIMCGGDTNGSIHPRRSNAAKAKHNVTRKANNH